MKKKLIILTIAMFFLNILNIQALNLGEVTDGKSSIVPNISPCAGQADGCAWYSQDFIVRVSLVDKNLNLVPGTKTVEFSPLNPYFSGNYETYDVDKSNSDYGYYQRTRIVYNFIGSHSVHVNGNVTGRQPQYMSDKGYRVYLGFGKDKAVANNSSDYEQNRRNFIKFVTRSEHGIYVQDIDKKVDFLSFFLKVSGYDNLWDSTDIIEKQIDLGKNHEYYLVIEPVYSYGVHSNGKDYTARGTAKQLAAAWTQAKGSVRDMMWIGGINLGVRYNHVCNFMDYNDKYVQLVKNLNVNYLIPNPSAEQLVKKYTPKQIVQMYGGYCRNWDVMDKLEANFIMGLLSTPQSGFGVNVIDITEVMEPRIKASEASCTLSIDSCAKDVENNVESNDDFYIRTKLTNTKGNLENCILPKVATEQQLDEYIYHVGEGNNQLWCYDDITYDFSNLKKYLKDNTFTTNQLMEIPKGKLKVERTCYATSENMENTGYLEQVFVADPAEYQTNFIFNFNNKELIFERNTNKYKDEAENYKRESECTKGRRNDQCEYKNKYTSTFYYDYELKDSFSGNQLNINISNLSLNNDIKNTNSIEFITQYQDSKVLRVDNSFSDGTYTNKLSTQLTNGYGLTNKMYNKLLSKTTNKKTINNNTDDEIEINRLDNNKVSETLQINFEQNRKKTCNVETTINQTPTNGPTQIPNTMFRVISLTNPFPARDGTSRLPGYNWLSKTDNNVYTYIENNRNIKSENKDAGAEAIYQKEPLYTIALTPSTMVKIREYNKSHTYSDFDMTCENGTGRMCIDNFIRDNKYLPSIEGTCSSINAKEITNINNRIIEFEKSGCNNYAQCMTMKQSIVNELDFNKDNYVTSDDLLNADFYTCADKTALSGK